MAMVNTTEQCKQKRRKTEKKIKELDIQTRTRTPRF